MDGGVGADRASSLILSLSLDPSTQGFPFHSSLLTADSKNEKAFAHLQIRRKQGKL